jgi:hypothetical protein
MTFLIFWKERGFPQAHNILVHPGRSDPEITLVN